MEFSGNATISMFHLVSFYLGIINFKIGITNVIDSFYRERFHFFRQRTVLESEKVSQVKWGAEQGIEECLAELQTI